jgi:hypothetical protein
MAYLSAAKVSRWDHFVRCTLRLGRARGIQQGAVQVASRVKARKATLVRYLSDGREWTKGLTGAHGGVVRAPVRPLVHSRPSDRRLRHYKADMHGIKPIQEKDKALASDLPSLPLLSWSPPPSSASLRSWEMSCTEVSNLSEAHGPAKHVYSIG